MVSGWRIGEVHGTGSRRVFEPLWLAEPTSLLARVIVEFVW
jgi:hypothetical protein